MQRQRHEHKIQQLQRTARALQAGEAGCPAPEAVRLQEQQQGLEKIRQQLLCAAGLLTSFVNQTVDRTMNDWTSSNEKAVTSLLRTLEELKSELSASGPSPRKLAAEDQAQLLDGLLKDNASLTQALRAAAREKAGLRGAAARLERALAHHVLRGCALGMVVPLQTALQAALSGIVAEARQVGPQAGQDSPAERTGMPRRRPAHAGRQGRSECRQRQDGKAVPALPESRELPKGPDLPEEVPAAADRRVPGLRAGNSLHDRPPGGVPFQSGQGHPPAAFHQVPNGGQGRDCDI